MAGEGVAQGLNARKTALAGVGIGLIGSGQAIQYNPAGLAFMEGREVYLTYVDWISGTRNYVAGVSAFESVFDERVHILSVAFDF